MTPLGENSGFDVASIYLDGDYGGGDGDAHHSQRASPTILQTALFIDGSND